MLEWRDVDDSDRTTIMVKLTHDIQAKDKRYVCSSDLSGIGNMDLINMTDEFVRRRRKDIIFYRLVHRRGVTVSKLSLEKLANYIFKGMTAEDAQIVPEQNVDLAPVISTIAAKEDGEPTVIKDVFEWTIGALQTLSRTLTSTDVSEFGDAKEMCDILSLCSLGCGSGKTLFALLMAFHLCYLESGEDPSVTDIATIMAHPGGDPLRTVIIVPSPDMVHQAQADLFKVAAIDHDDHRFAFISDATGGDKIDAARVVVVSATALRHHAGSITKNQFDIGVLDEAQMFLTCSQRDESKSDKTDRQLALGVIASTTRGSLAMSGSVMRWPGDNDSDVVRSAFEGVKSGSIAIPKHIIVPCDSSKHAFNKLVKSVREVWPLYKSRGSIIVRLHDECNEWEPFHAEFPEAVRYFAGDPLPLDDGTPIMIVTALKGCVGYDRPDVVGIVRVCSTLSDALGAQIVGRIIRDKNAWKKFAFVVTISYDIPRAAALSAKELCHFYGKAITNAAQLPMDAIVIEHNDNESKQTTRVSALSTDGIEDPDLHQIVQMTKGIINNEFKQKHGLTIKLIHKTINNVVTKSTRDRLWEVAAKFDVTGKLPSRMTLAGRSLNHLFTTNGIYTKYLDALIIDFPNYIKQRLELRMEKESRVIQVLETPEDVAKAIDSNGGMATVRKLVGAMHTPTNILMNTAYNYITDKVNAKVVLTITNANTVTKSNTDKKSLVKYVPTEPVSMTCGEWASYLVGPLKRKSNQNQVRAVWPNLVVDDVVANYVAFCMTNGFEPRNGIDTPYNIKKIDVAVVVRVAKICGLGKIVASMLPFTRCHIHISHSAGNGSTASFDNMLSNDKSTFRSLYDTLPSSVTGKQLLATIIKLQSFDDDDTRRKFLCDQIDHDGDVVQQPFSLGVVHFFKNRYRVSVDKIRSRLYGNTSTPCPYPASAGCIVCISRDIVVDDEKHDDIKWLIEAHTGRNGSGNKSVMSSRKLSARQIKLVDAHLAQKKKKKKKKRKRKTSTTAASKLRKVDK
jgi:hypothetical protein